MAYERLEDAKALLDKKRWGYAYYVAGYAIECALKSCILAQMTETGWVFHDKWKADECRTHDIGSLIKLAGLTDALNQRIRTSAASGDQFNANWGIAKTWDVEKRYQPNTEADARQLYIAITDTPDGVLQWVRQYW